MSLILTKAGLAAYAQAEATGIKLQATHMAVGDGNGEAVAHTSDSLALVNEVWRGALQEITVAPSGEVEFIAHVPVTVGGWYIRELAVYGADTLLAVGAHPELWKPDPTAPDKVELEITAPIKFDNAATLNLVVDTTKVLASQSHVAVKIAEHDAAPEAHGNLLADKADVDHTHAMADVSGLGAALADKAEVGHGHEISGVNGLQTALDAKSNEGHGHTIANTSGLQAALDAKANTSHTHPAANITDLLTTSRSYSAVQAYTPVALSINAAKWVAWDMTAAPVAVLVLNKDVVGIAITNAVAGSSPVLHVTQDGVGAWVMAWPANIKWPGGTAHEVSAAANSMDIVQFDVTAGGTLCAQGAADFKVAS
jgi:Phage-related tail fibre protein